MYTAGRRDPGIVSHAVTLEEGKQVAPLPQVTDSDSDQG